MHRRPPAWRDSADAWFKLLGAIVFGYLILAGVAALLRQYGDVAIILVGGILLAYLVLPAVTCLRSRLPLWAALAIVYATGLFAIAAFAYVLVPAASAQFTAPMDNNVPRIHSFVLSRISPRHRPAMLRLLDEIDNVLGGFVRGQLIVAAIVGTLATIALLILQVPYALLIGACVFPRREPLGEKPPG